MAEALVSKVLEELVSFAVGNIYKEFSPVSRIKRKVENLRGIFETIQPVLHDAEERQIKNQRVRGWLDELKQVSYEMDAVLDEWNTAITLRSNLKLSGKVLFYTHSCFRPNQVHRLGLRRRIASKIEELDKKLTILSQGREKFAFSIHNFNKDTSYFTSKNPKITSSIDVTEVYGREREKDVLVKFLCESDQVGTGHAVISIVGRGGIGKTTLAQVVYNDEKVNTHFDLKIWVCVSDPFDKISIARAIVEALKVKGARELVEFEALLQCIHESIKGKRFFLVLDDVWTEDYRKWEQLEKSLGNGSIGSKILVTTRSEEVALRMETANRMISLGPLSQEVCWSIFSRLAFFDMEKCEHLEKIGREIALKCAGLPLIAKALGSLMRFREYTKEHWEDVLHSKEWELRDHDENEVFIPFLLCYHDLPPFEKRCFSYCSYFERDYKITRDELIKLWMSQGLLSSTKDYERKGVDCFENLAARSFFQDFEKDENGDIIACKMHDLVHDFVRYLTKNEFINMVTNSREGNWRLADKNAFHCTLVLESGARIPTSIFDAKNLRTLSVRNLGSQTTIRWDLLLRLKCLRTLSLHECSLKQLPKNIDKLIHLRYLSLYQRYGLIKLPETMCNLFNLQTLELRESVSALPKGIGKLVNLRHLYLGRPMFLPKELGNLTLLETLDFVSITSGSSALSKEVMKLDDFSKLKHLKGRLAIHIGKVEDVEEAESAQLKNKERLVHLVLNLYGSCTLEPACKAVLLLEGLQPHPNLKHLEICSYYGIKVFPSWMISLTNLKTLVLERGRNCEFLGAFGKLPSLESLTVSVMAKVKRVGLEFLGIEADGDATWKMETCSAIISFPKLKQLEFFDLSSWEEWESESCTGSSLGKVDLSCFTIMPSLVSLKISWCYDLKPPLPAFLRKTPLQKLTINYCKYLEQRCQEGMRTEDLVKILTSITSESITEDTVGVSEMTEATTSRDKISPEQEQEITQVH